MKINKEWHKKNKMPKNPAFEQRVKWHLEHQKHCKCDQFPKNYLKKWERKNQIDIMKPKVIKKIMCYLFMR